MGWPAEIAWRIFWSSWPDFTSTLTPGLAASKSSTTDWMTPASRSVKKCQNWIVPDTVGGAEAAAVGPSEAEPLHAAVASASDTRAGTTRSARRDLTAVLRSGGCTRGHAGGLRV